MNSPAFMSPNPPALRETQENLPFDINDFPALSSTSTHDPSARATATATTADNNNATDDRFYASSPSVSSSVLGNGSTFATHMMSNGGGAANNAPSSSSVAGYSAAAGQLTRQQTVPTLPSHQHHVQQHHPPHSSHQPSTPQATASQHPHPGGVLQHRGSNAQVPLYAQQPHHQVPPHLRGQHPHHRGSIGGPRGNAAVNPGSPPRTANGESLYAESRNPGSPHVSQQRGGGLHPSQGGGNAQGRQQGIPQQRQQPIGPGGGGNGMSPHGSPRLNALQPQGSLPPNTGSAASSKFGLTGLLQVIRMTDPDLNILALGTDLTRLGGLNLNSTDVLYPTFASPWAESPAPRDPDYVLPYCYYMQPPALKTSHLTKFQLETLFYIFYNMPKDLLQVYAAKELYNREWRYHKKRQIWMKQQQQGQWVWFNPDLWQRTPLVDQISLDEVMNDQEVEKL